MLELKYDEATKKFSFTSRFNYGSLLKSQPFVAMVAKNDLTRIVSSFGSRGDDDDEEGIMSRFAFFLFDSKLMAVRGRCRGGKDEWFFEYDPGTRSWSHVTSPFRREEAEQAEHVGSLFARLPGFGEAEEYLAWRAMMNGEIERRAQLLTRQSHAAGVSAGVSAAANQLSEILPSVERERDKALKERDEALKERNEARHETLAQVTHLTAENGRLSEAFERVTRERDGALEERDRLTRLVETMIEKAEALTASRDMLRKDRDEDPWVSLNVIRDIATATANKNGFTEATVGEDIALMHSELSEALEDWRIGKGVTEVWYDHTKAYNGVPKPCGIPIEMCDVILRIAHFAGRWGIDLARYAHQKAHYNEQRPPMHGGKRI